MPGIPNYNLEECHRAVPLFQTVKPVMLFYSLRSLTLRLWDEHRQKRIDCGRLQTLRRQKSS